MECPKCHFDRKAQDQACPKCGIIYAKYELLGKKKAEPFNKDQNEVELNPDHRKTNKKQYHVVASIILFLAAFFFPGFYHGQPSEPSSSIALLLTGWLGPIAGYFSWYANPLYLLALILRRTKRIALLSLELISLLLALSFLLYRKIIVSEAPTFDLITEYGWGYYFWILAIAVLYFGDLSRDLNAKKKTEGLVPKYNMPLVVGVITILFFLQHFLGVHSQFQVGRRRERVFKEKCNQAGETIYRKYNIAVNGLYFHRAIDGGLYNGVDNGIYSSRDNEHVAKDMLKKGLIKYYEVDNDLSTGKTKPYRRVYEANNYGVEVGNLNSEYTVTTKYLGTDEDYGSYRVQSELDIDGYEITILENKSKLVIAKTTYFSTPIGHRFCGCPVEGKFSTEDFLVRVINSSPSEDKKDIQIK
jgi:hypothetical protein